MLPMLDPRLMAVLSAAVLALACATTASSDGGGTGGSAGGGTGGSAGGAGSSGGGQATGTGAVYDASTLTREGQLTAADWTLFKQRRYFFGHQSVGANLLAGLEALGASDDRYAITVQFAYQPVSGFSGPGLYDKGVGENYQPYGKISGFDAQVRGTLAVGNHVDIAFFKFCYVDFSDTTDVGALAQAYITEMNALEADYPSMAFLWTTAPLTASSDAANLRRNEYAQAIRAYAAAHGKPLYDLAALEAVSAAGSRCQFTSGGATYDKLCTEWAA